MMVMNGLVLHTTAVPSKEDRPRIFKADLMLHTLTCLPPQVSERAAAALADPAQFPDMFPDLEWALRVEGLFKQNRETAVPATE
jgi:hypothetical protein